MLSKISHWSGKTPFNNSTGHLCSGSTGSAFLAIQTQSKPNQRLKDPISKFSIKFALLIKVLLNYMESVSWQVSESIKNGYLHRSAKQTISSIIHLTSHAKSTQYLARRIFLRTFVQRLSSIYALYLWYFRDHLRIGGLPKFIVKIYRNNRTIENWTLQHEPFFWTRLLDCRSVEPGHNLSNFYNTKN